MDILKNSEKYTVFRIKRKKKTLILKISNRSPNKIFREINHIKKLKKLSKFFNKKIPSITKYGKIEKGINKNKGFYEMTYIKGNTLSDIFRKDLFKKKQKTIFEELSNILLEEIRNSKHLKLKKKGPLNFSEI